MVDIQRPRYCPYCACILPKIQERPSLEDMPFETCKACGEVFVVVTTKDLKKLIDILPITVS